MSEATDIARSHARASDFERGRVKGYAAGLKAAAKCAQQHGSTPGRELAETIRTLAKEES